VGYQELNKSVLGIIVAVVIGIGIVLLISYNSPPSPANSNGTKGESVGISGNVQVTKVPTNNTGKQFTVQLNESLAVTQRP
jgi:hypothetical protein